MSTDFCKILNSLFLLTCTTIVYVHECCRLAKLNSKKNHQYRSRHFQSNGAIYFISIYVMHKIRYGRDGLRTKIIIELKRDQKVNRTFGGSFKRSSANFSENPNKLRNSVGGMSASIINGLQLNLLNIRLIVFVYLLNYNSVQSSLDCTTDTIRPEVVQR